MVLSKLSTRGVLLSAVPALALGLVLGGANAAQAGEPGPSKEQARQVASQLRDAFDGIRKPRGAKAAAAPASVLGDFDADGKADTLARDTSGRLFLYAGTGDGDAPYRNRAQVGSNWQIYSALVRHGDFNGDGRQDVLARDAGGVLWFYAGAAGGGLVARTPNGGGWNAFSRLLGVGDWTGDGRDDLAAIDTAGRMFLYPGTGGAAVPLFGARRQLGTGWNSYDARISVGDLNGDRGSELFTRDRTGVAWMHQTSGNPAAPLRPRERVGAGWEVFNLLTSTGDLDGRGRPDIVGRDEFGSLYLFSSDRTDPDPTIGHGWNIYDTLL